LAKARLGYKLGLAFLWQKLLPEKSREYVPRLRQAKTWEELAQISNEMRDILPEIQEETGRDSVLAVLFVKKGRPKKKQRDILDTSMTETEAMRQVRACCSHKARSTTHQI
jgi:hypothetical protein